MLGLVFTPEQFKTLLRMIYVANTVACGVGDAKASDHTNEYDDLEQYIFSRAGDAGFPAATWKHKVPEGEHHHPSKIFEDDPELVKLMDAYDASVAELLLAEKLGERDIEKKHGREAREKMSAEDYELLLDTHIQRYTNEFAEHGFTRLVLEKEEIQRGAKKSPTPPTTKGVIL